MSQPDDFAKNVFQNYCDRFFIHPLSQNIDLPFFDLAIIIPAYGEFHLQKTLISLCQNPVPEGFNVLVLVVLNNRRGDGTEIILQNESDLFQTEKLNEIQSKIQFRVLNAMHLEDKNAGVGLARKIGMDACILSLRNRGGNPFLVCLDADCEVSQDYIQKLFDCAENPKAEVLTLEFDHKIDSSSDPELATGILNYELFLEYYRLGLSISGYPFFQHTVGSSMACRAVPYALSGGMNQRKAGEDFYFLHKLFPHYQSVELKGPLVFPSARISERVPFGTGRFQQNWKKEGKKVLETYHPEIFKGLGLLLLGFGKFLENNWEPAHFQSFIDWHPSAAVYFEQEKIQDQLQKIWKASPKPTQRKKALFRWFDGLMALKFVHYFQAFMPKMEVKKAIHFLLPEMEIEENPKELVRKIRDLLSQKITDNFPSP
jgi:hypothetical protein